MHGTIRTARPRASLRQGRNDWYRITNLGGGTASLYIYDEIGWFGVTASDLVDELSQLTGVTAIDLHINSPGGDVFDGLAIMNCLRAHPANVTTYVDGIAASIASVIAMAGDRIVMGAHSQFMIHEGSGLCIGDADDMRKTAELLDFQSDNIAGVYAAKAGGTPEEWRTRMRAETWFTAEEAVAAGLADEVTKRPASEPGDGGQTAAPAMDNEWDLSVFRYAGREAAPAPTATAEGRNTESPVREGEPTPRQPLAEDLAPEPEPERELAEPVEETPSEPSPEEEDNEPADDWAVLTARLTQQDDADDWSALVSTLTHDASPAATDA